MRTSFFLGAVAVMACMAVQARAAFITNVSTGTAVFADDYENQTVGTKPTTANMNPGVAGSSDTWTIGTAASGGSNNVANSDPLAYQGNNYLKLVATSGNGASRSATAKFAALNTGETVEMSYAYYVAAGGTSTFLLQSSAPATIFNMQPTGTGGAYEFYDNAGSLNATATLTGGVADTWHTALIRYTQGTRDLSLTIDGVQETVVNAVSATDAARLPAQVVLRANTGSTVGWDAVPEPSVCVLGCIGVVILAGRRRVRQNY